MRTSLLGRNRDDPTTTGAFLVLSGLLAAVALGQIVQYSSSDPSASATVGGLLAIVTATALWMGNPIRVVAEWGYFGLALIALAPALLSLGGDSCSSGLTTRAQIAVIGVFGLTVVVITATLVVLRQNWSELRYVGLGWLGFVDAMAYWNAPGPWSLLGHESASLTIALVAGAACGFLLGFSPPIGMAIISVALALGALTSFTETAPSCTGADNSSTSVTLLSTYLVVSLLLWMASRAMRR